MASVSQIIRRRRRRRAEKRTARNSSLNGLLIFIIVIAIGVVVPLGIVGSSMVSAYVRALNVLPEPLETLFRDPVIGATQIYDASGQTLLFAVSDPLGDEREWITLGELPAYVGEATVLWEDPNFARRSGFDLFRTADRLLSNWFVGPLEADTSLTGRLVRNVITPSDDYVTVDSRALEYALVAEINRIYDHDEIIEWHLNTNYYGNEAYGIEAAAQVYLGKSARDLTLDEAALLIAIPTAPTLNPVDNETAARGRQTDILRRMLASDIITPTQFEAAINVFTEIRPDAGQAPLVAPDFALYARRQAETLLNLLGFDGAQMVTRGGLQITTTLDLDLYYQADCLMRTHLARLEGVSNPQVSTLDGNDCFSSIYLPAIQPSSDAAMPNVGTVVIMDVDTAEIRAMVGDGTRVRHQPGATLHPFVYLDGFINPSPNYTAATMLLDIPNQVFPGAADGLIYQPRNPDAQFRGPMSLRDAMGAGLLPPVVEVANVLNLNNVLRDTIFPMGINSLRGNVYDLSLLERGGAVSVLDMVYAYSIFASMGEFNGIRIEANLRNHDPVAIKRIADQEGNILWEYNEQQVLENREPLLQREVAYLVNDILADQSTRWQTLGQNNTLEMDRQTAVVQGITGDRLDNWTIGYTPQVITGVWVGRENQTPITLPGFAIEGAAPIWRAIMDYVHLRDNIAPSDWPRPDSIVQSQVCEVSGGSPNGACETRSEIFLAAGQIPDEDRYWELIEVNAETGQRASANTPVTLRTERSYFIPPEDAMDWWRANNRPLPPEDFDLVSRSDLFSSASITQPDNLEIVGGVVPILGEINAESIQYYQLAYGIGQAADQWFNLTEQITSYIPDAPLASWDTASLEAGTYTLRLSVWLPDGTIDRAFIPVIVDNVPPTNVLTAGEPGQVFQWPQDETIPIVAQVTDNIRYEQVDFYHNGTFVGSDVEFPFEYQHRINRTGQEQFTAIAYDAAGNSTTAEIFVEVVR